MKGVRRVRKWNLRTKTYQILIWTTKTNLKKWIFEDLIKHKKAAHDCISVSALRRKREFLDYTLNATFDELGFDETYGMQEYRILAKKRLYESYLKYITDLQRTLYTGIRHELDDKAIEELSLSYEYTLCESKTDEIPARTALDWLGKFLSNGLIPPPEILTCIASAYGQYVKAGGNITLEQAFFDPLRTGKQSYAKTLQSHDQYKNFDHLVKCLKTPDPHNKSKPESLHDIAHKHLDRYRIDKEIILSEDEFESYVDAFLRGYRRWKKKQNADI